MTTNLKMYLEADSLTEEELIDFAETGDILLFSYNTIPIIIEPIILHLNYKEALLVVNLVF